MFVAVVVVVGAVAVFVVSFFVFASVFVALGIVSVVFVAVFVVAVVVAVAVVGVAVSVVGITKDGVVARVLLKVLEEEGVADCFSPILNLTRQAEIVEQLDGRGRECIE